MSDNCVYCDRYESIWSDECQGYMPFCHSLNKKINIYEDHKNCEANK